MFVKLLSTTLVGIDACRVTIETYVTGYGEHVRFTLVGLPDGVVKEAKDRVRCAIINSGFIIPKGEIIVNLAPASLPKLGSGFDLAIGVSVLASLGYITSPLLPHVICIGELALDGSVKEAGVEITTSLMLREEKSEQILIVSESCREKLEHFSGVNVIYCNTLKELVHKLHKPEQVVSITSGYNEFSKIRSLRHKKFSDVIGQKVAKRAMEIAAAGGHNMLMIGPPGGGKTMLAERIINILPQLSIEESYSVNKIHAAVRTVNESSKSFTPILQRQFRTPHHSVSLAGLVGGGKHVTPGEISLAHQGVLFLDELPELRRDVLEALREPLEKRKISISRAQYKLSYPADFILIAAMNPCPCGLRGTKRKDEDSQYRYAARCKCTELEVSRYIKKISGPLLDRIDIQIWIPQIELEEIQKGSEDEGQDEEMKERVGKARSVQSKRYRKVGKLNSHMLPTEIKKFCDLDANCFDIIKNAAHKFNLSARGYSRILKLSRTIADMDAEDVIQSKHLIEALSYRIQFS